MNLSPIKTGFFKIHRKFFSHPLWMEPRELSRAEAFLDMLQLAAFAPTKVLVKGDFVELEAGQLIASDRLLAGRWRWSTSKIRGFIISLEKESMVTTKRNRQGTILTLTNYDRYAGSEITENPQKNHGEPIEKSQKNLKEEHKNIRNKRAVEIPPAPFASEHFAKCWEDWTDHRKSMRKPMTAQTIKTLFEEFAEWGEAKTIGAIRYSIKKGWQGVYPEDVPQSAMPSLPKPESPEQAAKRERAARLSDPSERFVPTADQLSIFQDEP